MRMHVTQQGLQRLPLHTESEGRTILVSGANEKILVLDKQTPHDVGNIHASHECGESELQNEGVTQNLLVSGDFVVLWKCLLDEWCNGVKNVILGLVLGSCDPFDCMLDNELHLGSSLGIQHILEPKLLDCCGDVLLGLQQSQSCGDLSDGQLGPCRIVKRVPQRGGYSTLPS